MDMSGNYNNAFQPPLMAYPFQMHNQTLFEQPYIAPMPTQYPNPRALIPTPKPEKRKQEPLICDACGIEVNSQQMMDAHIRGQKHIKKMKLKTVTTSTTSVEIPTLEQQNIPMPTVPEPIVAPVEQNSTLSTVNKSTSSNDKSVLQSLNELAKFNKVISKYDLTKETGPAHNKTFEVQLTLGNEIYHGTGTSIKRAQQFAAEQALSMTNLRKPDSTPRGSRNNHPQRINPPRETVAAVPPPIRSQYAPISSSVRPKTSSIPCDQFFHTKNNELTDDSHIISQLQTLVDDIERALKTVSDKIMEQCKQQNLLVIPRLPENVKLNNNEQDNEDPSESFRMLKGAMKVSTLAMRLFYRYDREYFLVLICANKPTSTLLNEISQELTIGLNAQAIAALQLDSNNEDMKPITYEIETNISEAYLTVQCSLLPTYKMKILLTSPVFRTENFLNIDETKSEQIAQLNPDPEDMLNKDKCLEAAAEIRHSNWFTRCMMENPTNTIVIRLLRHLQCQQTPLKYFSFWCLTLLVNKCQNQPIHSTAQLFRLVFAYLSSGILLENQLTSAIVDPCEKDLVDAAACLSTKQRLDITNYANYVLRLIAFEKYETIFDAQHNKQIKTEI